jgi:hypothetical protein
MINKANALFWQYEALRDKVNPSDEERALLLGYAAIGYRMRRLAAQKGTTNSAKVRGDNAERQRCVHDLRDSGKTPKQIQSDRKFRRKYKVSLATIYRDLKARRL